jgi:molybdopterin-binding protein
MNTLRGKISELTTSGNMTLVGVDVGGTRMTAIMIGRPGKVPYLRMSGDVELLFNEAAVSLGKMIGGQISLNNQLDCTIERLVFGEILTQVILTFQGERLTSLITTMSAKRLDLTAGDRVTAFIKTNEVMLKEPDEARNGD